MEYRTLNNGERIPCMGIGTFRIRPEDCEISVPAAIGASYRLIDTANVYLNEKAVGRGVKNRRFFKVPKAMQKIMFSLGKINFEKQP